MKKLIKIVFSGVSLGLSIFVIIGIVFDIANSGNTAMSDWQFTRMAVAAMLIGVGFSVPSLVYTSEKLSYGLKVLIQMGIGCTVMLIAAFCVGWIPVEAGWKISALVIGAEILIAFIIWLCFFLHYKKLAKQMNQKIKEKESE